MSEVTTKWRIEVVGEEPLEFDWKKILNVEAIAIEKAIKITWNQFLVGMLAGHADSITAAIWILRKRSNPKLQFSEVVFSMGDVQVIDPDEEDAPEPDERPQDEPLEDGEPQELPNPSAQEE